MPGTCAKIVGISHAFSEGDATANIEEYTEFN